MKMKFLKNNELDDHKIIATLIQLAKDYENGEIIEVRDTLVDIVSAIDEFEKALENKS